MIPRIIREAQELGLPELQIMEIGMRLRFTVTLAEQITVQKPTGQVTGQEKGMRVRSSFFTTLDGHVFLKTK
jgi:hypothetical protein